MIPRHKRAIQLYQQTQQLGLRPEPLYHDAEYEVVRAEPPHVIYIRDQRAEPAPRKEPVREPDLMGQVFVAAFFGSAAFFVLWALITLMAGGRS
jgi:hypothetical protein